ncbi:MAG: hypothetical protein IPK72_06625 [Candidatus Eisenbacteria bacterium]|nr:hypothetical protein [Candidatus Eisenbacteria bacterium]
MYPGNVKSLRGSISSALSLLALGLGTSAWAWPVERAVLMEEGSDLLFSVKAPQAGESLPYDVFSLDNPHRVVVDLFGADSPEAVTGETAAKCLVGFRTSLWKDDPAGRVVRYVFETNGAMTYRSELKNGELEVRLIPTSAGKSSEATPGANPMLTPPAEEPLAPAPSASPAFSPDPLPLDEAPLLSDVDPRGASPAAPTASSDPECEPAVLAAQASGSKPMAESAVPGNPDPANEPLLADAGPALSSAVDSARPGAARQNAAASLAASNLAASNLAASNLAASNHAGSASAPSPTGANAAFGGSSAGSTLSRASLTQASNTKPMNLDVQEADLRTVFRSIAEFGKVNIVADRDVQGPVSVRLVNTPWREALDIVCRSALLVALDESEDVIRISTLRAFREEMLERESAARKRDDLVPVTTRVYTVDYASAKELRSAINPALSPRGSAEVDERTNSLIVRDIDTRHADVANLIDDLDQETRQVEILAQLVDIDATATTQLGVDWSLANLHSTAERISGGANVTEPVVTPSGSLRFGVVREWGDIQGTLDALERTNRANIISNPKITTTNNRKAKILVGKEIPLITLDERGNPVTELKKVGISLEVIPYINGDNRITMDLHPEVSDLSSQATVTGGLIFTTSNADTRVMVDNGETAVIGGLIRTNETKFEQGIPVLKSIPLLGTLFKSSDTRREKRELVILVTPTIVEPVAKR